MSDFIEGLLFIAAGLVLLGNTTGYVGWRVWADIASYWPVVLILMGVLVLFRRRVPGVLVGLLLVLVGLNFVLLPMGFAGGWPAPGGGRRPWRAPAGGTATGSVAVSRPLEPGISAVDVTIDLGAGSLSLSGGAAGAIECDLDYSGAKPVFDYRRSGSRAIMSLKGEHAWGRPSEGGASWRVRLNETVPVSIDMDAGAIRADMDLSSVRISALDVGMGAGRLDLTLGDNGMATDVTINTGAAEVIVTVPSSVGMRVKTSSAFTEQNLGSAGFTKNDGYWVSANYGSTKSTVELKISSAFTKLRVERP